MPELSVRELSWGKERDAIVALRVRVLSNQDQSGFFEEQPVTDALDDERGTLHFAAFEGQRAVGAVRLCSAEVRAWFLPQQLEGLGVTAVSRLEVAPDRAVEGVMAPLFCEAYQRARAIGSLAWVAVVLADEVPRWTDLGFVAARIDVRPPWRGLIMDLADVVHLRTIGSPLAAVAQRYINTDDHKERIAALRGPPEALETAPHLRPEPRAEPGVWVLSDEALAEPRLLEAVDRPLLKAILGRSPVSLLDAGAVIPLEDGALLEVVDGELVVEAEEPVPLLRVRRREVLGVEALAALRSRQVNLRALRATRVLSLSPADLDLVSEEAPELALGLYRNACSGLRRSLRRATDQLRALANEQAAADGRPRRRATVPRILARTA